MKKRILHFCFSILCTTLFGQINEREIVLPISGGVLVGTLSTPNLPSYPLAILVAGSGPTDRDGNSGPFKANNLKKLSDSLVRHGIATFRFDKRGVGKSSLGVPKEDSLTIDTYVADLVMWHEYHRKNPTIKRFYILGHSEGSLMGILAAQKIQPDGFVSIAGVGNSADILLKKQLMQTPASVKQSSYVIIDSLRKNKPVPFVPMDLMPLFRPSVQPYLKSWMRYKPNQELRKLNCPSLIVQGTRDAQVDVQEAYLLIGGNPKAQLELIDHMNHVLFDERNGPRDYVGQAIAKPLIEKLVLFIK